MEEEKKTRNRTAANGEGGCKFIEKKNLWCCRITIGWDADGKQIRKAFYGKKKRDATDKATAAQARVMNGQAAVSSDMKLSDWADKWSETYCSQLSPRTVTGYKSVIENLIKPEIGKYALKDLKPIHIQQMITDLVSRNLSKSHVNRARIIANDMLNVAIDNDLLIKNPCRKITLPPMPANKRKQEPFTDDEIKSIYKYVPNYLTQNKPHVTRRIGKIIIVLIRTGLRQEELLGLQWKDIDFMNNILMVRRAVTIKDGIPLLKEAKTMHSVRDIPMHKDARKIFCGLEKKNPDDLIFGTENGTLLFPRNFSRDYKNFFEAAKKAKYNINYRSPHCCRHTFASTLRAAGVDLKTISELLGHSRIQITDIYTHTNSKAKADAIARL